MPPRWVDNLKHAGFLEMTGPNKVAPQVVYGFVENSMGNLHSRSSARASFGMTILDHAEINLVCLNWIKSFHFAAM